MASVTLWYSELRKLAGRAWRGSQTHNPHQSQPTEHA